MGDQCKQPPADNRRRGRRKMVAWNDDYMLRIITGQAYA
jgi:hypothetical protein